MSDTGKTDTGKTDSGKVPPRRERKPRDPGKVPYEDSWIHRQPGGERDPNSDGGPGGGSEAERERREKLRVRIERGVREERQRPRKDRFLPYLLVRTAVGDRGDRPFAGVFWESPDIWIAAGDPASTPDIPSSPGGTVTAGSAQTLYAHVWNLGMAPLAGIRVEFYWFNPSLVIDLAHAHLIGIARVDLGPRTSSNCHRLVKCPTAWVPVLENNGHECLIVRVRGLGDEIGLPEWLPSQNRHVAQRNMCVVAAHAPMSKLLESLDKSRAHKGVVQLVQVGRHDAPDLRLLDGKLVADAHIETHVLAELQADGSIELPATRHDNPAIAPAVGRAELKKGPAAAPQAGPRATPKQALAVRRVVTGELFTSLRAKPGAKAAHAKSGIVKLFTHEVPAAQSLHLKRAAHPVGDTAQVLRVASFDEQGQLAGGYTIVVRG